MSVIYMYTMRSFNNDDISFTAGKNFKRRKALRLDARTVPSGKSIFFELDREFWANSATHARARSFARERSVGKGFAGDRFVNMGCASSAPSSAQERECARLASKTKFTSGQIGVLQRVFSRVSGTNERDGVIDAIEFQRALFGRASGGDGDAGKGDLFSARIFSCFDSASDERLSFEEFVRGLNVFHPETSRDAKTKFAFRVYDLQDTGEINRDDVRRMLEAVLSQSTSMSLTAKEIEAAVNKTFEDCDLTKNGVISLKEFESLVEKNDKVIANMTMPRLQRLTKEYPEFLFA